jgi:uncharacterized membrane protein
VYSYAENLKSSLIGTAVILAGVPLFGVFRKQPRTPAGSGPAQ